MSARKIKSFTERLLLWYSSNARNLPWRTTQDPYRIWLSEVMAQQTQVSRVHDYYLRFLKRFPTLQSLAKARWSEVLPLWRGLGYYDRGRNLLRTAKLVVKQHAGRLPEDEAALRSLPGIGVYTARAILSFAFGRPVAAIDTNGRRVFGRVFDVAGPKLENIAAQAFLAIVEARNPSDLNQAVMDLGAAVCRSRAPRCSICPLRTICCYARSEQKEPVAPAQRPGSANTVDVGAACIHVDGRYLVAKRPAAKGGGWEFPGGKRERGEDLRACLKREIKEELGIEISVRPPFLVTKTESDGRIYRVHFCRSRILRGTPQRREHSVLKWMTPEQIRNLPLLSSNRAAAEMLLEIGTIERRKRMRSAV